MKRLLAILLALSMVLALCACGSQAPAEPPEPEKPEDVKNVERLIAAIGEVSLEREKYITDAEGAYAELLEADKELVENAGELFAARERYNALLQQEADGVIRAIEAIGKVTFSEPRETEILAAEAAYEALPEGARELVTNYEDLLSARKSLDVLTQLKDAEARGESSAMIDGVKVSYLRDENIWAVVENELTEEYEPADLAYDSQSLRWTDVKRKVQLEVPAGWDREQHTQSYMVGFLFTNKDATMAMYLWCARLTEKQLQYEDPYKILDATAQEAVGSREHGEFHHSIYGQHRALWCRVDMGGTDTLFCFMLAGDVIVVLQGWRPDGALNNNMLGIYVHTLNSMIITNVE